SKFSSLRSLSPVLLATLRFFLRHLSVVPDSRPRLPSYLLRSLHVWKFLHLHTTRAWYAERITTESGYRIAQAKLSTRRLSGFGASVTHDPKTSRTYRLAHPAAIGIASYRGYSAQRSRCCRCLREQEFGRRSLRLLASAMSVSVARPARHARAQPILIGHSPLAGSARAQSAWGRRGRGDLFVTWAPARMARRLTSTSSSHSVTRRPGSGVADDG